MQFANSFFPGLSTPDITLSQRNYNYDPLGSLSVQSTTFYEEIGPSADNITNLTPQKLGGDASRWGHAAADPRMPQILSPGETVPFIGNIGLQRAAWFSQPGWYGEAGVGGINNNWDDLRQQGVGYGLYAPHLPQHPVPANKLYEPGSGFVLPATFLGQPLVAMAAPPGA